VFSQIDLYSLTGKLIKTYNTNRNNTAEIDISPFQPGIYLLKIKSSKGEVIGQSKLIKR